MRKPAQVKAPRGSRLSAPFYFPAPIGGMNTREPRALVPLNQSPYMQDCYPTTSGVLRRTSWARHVTGMPAQTNALMLYSTPSGTETLFAAAGTAFYNVTAAGAVGAAVVSGLTNADWQHVNFTNSAGTSYLCTFNGTDSPRYWDNATWTAVTGVSTPAITGLTTTTIVNGFVHQRRLWLVQVSSLKVWYLPVDSVGGAAQALDLGGVASRGGYVVSGSTWTVDGGDGLDDYWVAVTSGGQMIAYRGTDPTSASTWVHVGTWDISTPVGRRCLFRHKGDLLIITQSGVVSAGEVIRGNSTTSAMITDMIRGTYAAAYTSAAASSELLWSMAYHPKLDLLLLCLNGAYNGYMLPLNASTGAWGGGFTLYATCLAIFGGELYYAPEEADGSAGTQIRKLTGAADGSDEVTVVAYVDTAFSDFGLPGTIKQVSLGRIAGSVSTNDDPETLLQADSDFEQGSLGSAVTISQFSGLSQWLPLRNLGVNISLRCSMSTLAASTNNIFGFFVTYQPGGIVGSSSLT